MEQITGQHSQADRWASPSRWPNYGKCRPVTCPIVFTTECATVASSRSPTHQVQASKQVDRPHIIGCTNTKF